MRQRDTHRVACRRALSWARGDVGGLRRGAEKISQLVHCPIMCIFWRQNEKCISCHHHQEHEGCNACEEGKGAIAGDTKPGHGLVPKCAASPELKFLHLNRSRESSKAASSKVAATLARQEAAGRAECTGFGNMLLAWHAHCLLDSRKTSKTDINLLASEWRK